MNTQDCMCRGLRGGTWLKRASGALAAAILLLMPKCPACLAAYALAWTGLGLSVAAAASLRAALLLLAAAALLCMTVGHGRRLICRKTINPQAIP